MRFGRRSAIGYIQDMLHIVVHGGSKVGAIHAVKGHLDLMMGEIVDRISNWRPMFSFEPTEVDAKMVRELLEDLRYAGAEYLLMEDIDGKMEVIAAELFMNLLDQGVEISRQVRRDMAREIGEEERNECCYC